MKRVSKLLSVILVFALCFALSSPALAMSIEPAPTVVSSTDTVLEKTGGSILVLHSEDLSNGDARISMLEGGEVVSSTYVDRSASQLIWEQYNANNVVMREVKIVSQAVQLPNIEPQAMTQWITVGEVRYNHYVQDALLAIPRITWSYRSEVNESGSFNIGGRYRDITTVVAFLASLLFIPASAASAIFLQVLTNLDTAATTGLRFEAGLFESVRRDTPMHGEKQSGQAAAGKRIAYFGVSLFLFLTLLVIVLLRTFGVIAGGPVPWYLWVSILLGIVSSLYSLMAKNLSPRNQRILTGFLLVLYGGLLLYRFCFRDGIPDLGSDRFRMFAILAVVLVVVIPLVFVQDKIGLEEEELRKKRREEKLAELRRSMAPTKQEDGQSVSNRAAQDASDGQQSPP